MATARFRGLQSYVYGVDRFTPDAPGGAGEVYTIDINGKDVSYTTEAGDAVADVCDGLVSAWNTAASSYGEVNDGSISDQTTSVLVTQNSGRPPLDYTVTANITEAAVTAPSGPYHVGDVDNYSAGALPGAGDDLYIEADMRFGLGGLSAVALASVYVLESVTLGLGNSDYGYPEYRDRYLELDADDLLISNAGATCRIDLQAENLSVDVESCASCQFKNFGASANLRVSGGTVEIVPDPGDTTTVALVSTTGGVTVIHAGGTVVTVNVYGGQVEVRGTVTNLNVYGNGTAIVHPEGVVINFTLYGAATLDWRTGSTCTAGTMTDSDECTLTLENSGEAVTFTTLTATRGTINDPYSLLTLTNNAIQGKSISLGE